MFFCSENIDFAKNQLACFQNKNERLLLLNK